MELEEGKIYTTQQMQKFMGISKSTWDHRRDELLENFCLYYEYEVVYEGRSTKYHILHKLGDYQKPLSKRSKELRDQIYEKEIVGVIEQDNVQTAKNIARIIQKKDEIKEYHHTEGTVYEYTRLRVASMFGKKVGEGGTHGEIIEKIWCRADLEHNCYIPMSDEAIQQCKLDRFARTAIEGVQTVRELFERGVRVHILNMGLIENTLTGNLILTVMLAFAEYERGMIVERTQTGKAVARQDPSFKDGRPKKFTPEQIQLALDLLEQGKTYRQITTMTGISKSTLIRAKRVS